MTKLLKTVTRGTMTTVRWITCPTVAVGKLCLLPTAFLYMLQCVLLSLLLTSTCTCCNVCCCHCCSFILVHAAMCVVVTVAHLYLYMLQCVLLSLLLTYTCTCCNVCCCHCYSLLLLHASNVDIAFVQRLCGMCHVLWI